METLNLQNLQDATRVLKEEIADPNAGPLSGHVDVGHGVTYTGRPTIRIGDAAATSNNPVPQLNRRTRRAIEKRANRNADRVRRAQAKAK